MINWFWLATAALMLCAGILDLSEGRIGKGCLGLTYTVANTLLAINGLWK